MTQVSKTVVASTGGITLAGLATTAATIVQALQGHPTNPGGLVTGNLLTVVGLLGTIVHFHKGASIMATQNDVDMVVGRLRKAWDSFKSSGTLQRVEVDLSAAISLAEEIEAEVAKVAPPAPPETGTDTTSEASAETVAPSGSDFSKLSS